MSITFTSWTSCDHPTCPTLDWSSVEAIRNKLHWVYYEAVAQAYFERIKWGQVARSTEMPSGMVIVENAPIRSAFITTIASERNLFFSPTVNRLAFANHTLNGGEWSETSAGPDTWTAAALRTELGISSFNADTLLSAEWLYEQYQIINLMRFTREQPDILYFSGSYQSKQYLSSYINDAPFTWARMAAEIAASNWDTENSPGLLVGHWARRTGFDAGDPDYYRMDALKYRSNLSSREDRYTGASHADSVYLRFHTPGYFPNDAFECQDYPNAENGKWTKVKEVAVNSDAKINTTVNDIGGLTITEFSGDGTHGYTTQGWDDFLYLRDYYCDGGAVFRPPEEEEEEEE